MVYSTNSPKARRLNTTKTRKIAPTATGRTRSHTGNEPERALAMTIAIGTVANTPTVRGSHFTTPLANRGLTHGRRGSNGRNDVRGPVVRRTTQPLPNTIAQPQNMRPGRDCGGRTPGAFRALQGVR